MLRIVCLIVFMLLACCNPASAADNSSKSNSAFDFTALTMSAAQNGVNSTMTVDDVTRFVINNQPQTIMAPLLTMPIEDPFMKPIDAGPWGSLNSFGGDGTTSQWHTFPDVYEVKQIKPQDLRPLIPETTQNPQSRFSAEPLDLNRLSGSQATGCSFAVPSSQTGEK